ncbi:SDR family NAD(P)-dependent oxidoreductase [Natronosalvus rutilus]|uniref:SDR family oxidoreductase n=1 Tax=Natronosalvus rutilus TaxID=2953753 RepID=A0A9E7SU27_9EURY|nr:SDR family NAD(P)-dependent oxidoreductase [Natronosalvus rutilus]UTF53110.1 SDR family oxidoreductase [Natronosalvus rutilus]
MTVEQFHVDGDVAIVTGASSGIGRTIAERFADDGVDVVICSREQENVDPVADAIEDSDRPGNTLAVECDVTDSEAVAALVEATVETFGGLDILVNNAGASFMANFDGISENGWRTILDINLTGTYLCTHAAADHLKDGGGIVVNLSSVAGIKGAPYMSHYAAAKAGVNALTSSLGFEWASEGVRVNAVAPGFVATKGVEAQMGIAADEVDRDEIDRRMGTVEEIADVVQFLASPASSYLVGQTLEAGGKPAIMENPDT